MLFSEYRPKLPSSGYFNSNEVEDMSTFISKLNDLLYNDISNDREYPLFNVHADNEKAVITSLLPGVEIEELDIQVLHKTITVKVNQAIENEDKPESRWLKRERMNLNMVRSIELPFDIDSENIDASLSKGILTITCMRKESDKPRKISILSH